MTTAASPTLQQIKDLAFGPTPYYPFDQPLKDLSDPNHPLPFNEVGEPVEWDIGTFLIHSVAIKKSLESTYLELEMHSEPGKEISPETVGKVVERYDNFNKFLKLIGPFGTDFKSHARWTWNRKDPVTIKAEKVFGILNNSGFVEMMGEIAIARLRELSH